MPVVHRQEEKLKQLQEEKLKQRQQEKTVQVQATESRGLELQARQTPAQRKRKLQHLLAI